MHEGFKTVEWAEDFKTRFAGLMGKPSIDSGYAMFFPRCKSVHGMFMRVPISVVFLNDDYRVLEIRRLDPWRLAVGPKGTAHTLECALGEPERRGIKVGDTPIAPRTSASFEDACEVASRCFGLTTTSSCIEEAFSAGKWWLFRSHGHDSSGRISLAVDKKSLVPVFTLPVLELGNPRPMLLPRQYLPLPRPAAAETAEPRGEMRKTA